MSKACTYQIDEIRFLLRDNETWAYVHVHPTGGECPSGVPGWHAKAFVAERPLEDIAEEIRACRAAGLPLEWSRGSPPVWSEDHFPPGSPVQASPEPLEARKWP